jgi:nitronate monooxygenase
MDIRDLLETDLRVIQSPMAGVQDSTLAAAVGDAGGLGSLPCAMLSMDHLREELKVLTAKGGSYNANFFCHTPPVYDEAREIAWREALEPFYAELGITLDDPIPGPSRQPFGLEILETIAVFKPPVVSFHFGLPDADLVAEVKSWGSRILASATTVEEALWLESRGADGIIAQGSEAGGHRGMFLSDDVSTQVGTFALLPQVKAAVGVPVIAAGGIATSREVRAAIALGADAVQAGTSFLLCKETKTTDIHRAALRTRKPTALTNVFSGRPARSVVNRVIEELGPMSELAPAFPTAGAALAPLKLETEAAGLGDFSSLWSGQNRAGCREVPAHEVVMELATGF